MDDDSRSGVNLFDGPAIGHCVGVSGRSHAFLLHDGHSNCTKCVAVVCRSCQQSINAQSFCLGCYALRAILPHAWPSAKSIAYIA